MLQEMGVRSQKSLAVPGFSEHTRTLKEDVPRHPAPVTAVAELVVPPAGAGKVGRGATAVGLAVGLAVGARGAAMVGLAVGLAAGGGKVGSVNGASVGL